jgi:hydroxymethylbilane synthase
MLRVGTRGSKLALAQTEQVIEALRASDPELTVEAVVVSTFDSTIADKSRYTSPIEEQLRSEEIDVAVHSAKDVPGEESPGLLIASVPERAARHDVLLGAESLGSLKEGAVVGTSSLRRAAQLLSARPDLSVQPLRGNIDTRMARLQEGDFDAIVLAAAGMARLGVGDGLAQGVLDFVPAPGQGCLALQVRDIDLTATGILGPLSHGPSQRELTAERAAASGLIASCNTPLGVSAEVLSGAGEGGKDEIVVRGWLGLPDGTRFVEATSSGLASEAHLVGHLLAQKLRSGGGDEILAQAEELAA